MGWDRIVGQQRVKQQLRRSIESGQVAHAYLFHGIEGIGKDALAIEFARVLNCQERKSEACDQCPSCKKSEEFQHPNIQLIFQLPVGKGETKDHHPLEKLTEDQINEVREQLAMKAMNPYHKMELAKANFIKINSIREIRRIAAMSSFERGAKVFILIDADTMNAEASNALLKTLEEPPSNTIFMLTSSEKSRLLPTILSRCQLIQCDPIGESEIRDALVTRERADPEQATLVAALADGSYASARVLLSGNWVEERKSVVNFLRTILSSQNLALSNAIDGLSSSHDRVSLERWLKVLQSWLRDALVLKENGQGTATAQIPADDVRNFVEKFPQADLVLAIEDVERHIALLSRNVYIPLVLTNLSIDLKKHLSESST